MRTPAASPRPLLTPSQTVGPFFGFALPWGKRRGLRASSDGRDRRDTRRAM